MVKLVIAGVIGLLAGNVFATLAKRAEPTPLWMAHYRGFILPAPDPGERESPYRAKKPLSPIASSPRVTLDLAERGVYQLKTADATLSGQWHVVGDIAKLWIDRVEKKPTNNNPRQFPDYITTVYAGDGRPALWLRIVRDGDYLIEASHFQSPEPTMVFLRAK